MVGSTLVVTTRVLRNGWPGVAASYEQWCFFFVDNTVEVLIPTV